MSYGTIIQSGSFISGGIAYTLKLRSDLDWIQVYNWSTIIVAPAANATKFTWLRGMPANDGIYEGYVGGVYVTSNCLSVVGNSGFNLVSLPALTTPPVLALGAGTNVAAPVFTSANPITNGLSNGGIVRIVGTAMANLNGLDFTVTNVATPNFTLANALQQAPGVVAGAAGSWIYVAPDVNTYNLMYPSKRVISNITAANPGVVTTLVDHNYTSGQLVRIQTTPGGGMDQLNGQLVTVTVINAGSFSIGVDTTNYTAFTFPVAGYVFTPAIVVPVGENPIYLNNLDDSTINNGFIGITLNAGAYSPAGVNGNIIYWIAGKSENR